MRLKSILVAVFVAIACGEAIGAGTAVLEFRQHPWKGGEQPQIPPAAVGRRSTTMSSTSAKWISGRMASTSSPSPIKAIKSSQLNLGSTSCKCTVSEIKNNELAPGQSTKVVVSWHGDKLCRPLSTERDDRHQ